MNTSTTNPSFNLFESYDSYNNYSDYTIYDIYQKTTPLIRARIKKFWARNNILPQNTDAEERSRQVVLVSTNKDNDIVGISTAYTGYLKNHGINHDNQNPFFFYRTFIQPDDRIPMMFVDLAMTTFDVLDKSNKDSSLQGLVAVPDNPKFLRARVREYFRIKGFEMIGKRADGLLIFCKFFPR